MTQFANQLAPSNHQTSEPFELRPYQQHIISELYKLLKQGTKRILAEHSREITELLNTNGIVTEHLEADTPHKERHLMYARLASSGV